MREGEKGGKQDHKLRPIDNIIRFAADILSYQHKVCQTTVQIVIEVQAI